MIRKLSTSVCAARQRLGRSRGRPLALGSGCGLGMYGAARARSWLLRPERGLRPGDHPATYQATEWLQRLLHGLQAVTNATCGGPARCVRRL